LQVLSLKQEAPAFRRGVVHELHNNDRSVGIVTEDYAVAEAWVKEDEDNGFETVYVVTDPSEFKDTTELWHKDGSVLEAPSKEEAKNFLDGIGGA
jgi:hypothetical protein